jgi:hypothetical protein
LQKNFVNDFDYVVGTSTGGLIAFALFLDIPLPELEDIYKDFAKYFTLSSVAWYANKLNVSLPIFSAKYDPTAIHGKLKDLLDKKNKERQAKDLFPLVTFGDLQRYSEEKREKTGKSQHLIITSFDMTSSKSYVFNTGFPRHHQFEILEILYSTMAAPTYFPPHTMKVRKESNEYHNFVDGGIFANDPELAGLWAANLDNMKGNCIYRMFALGTGVFPLSVQATPPNPNPPPQDNSWGSYFSPSAWKNWYDSKRENLAKSFDGGYLSWFSNGGQLITVILEANRSFTENFTSELARFSDLKRFRFNLQTSSEAPLDDPGFVVAFDRELNTLVQRNDYHSLIAFLHKYIKTHNTDERGIFGR